MWRKTSSGKLTFVVMMILQAMTGLSQWAQSVREGDIAYFLFSGARVERYDLVNRQWLAPLNLPPTYGPAAVLAVDQANIYVGFGQNLRRFSLNGSNDTHLINVANSIHGVFVDGDVVLVNHSAGLYARFASLNRTNGTIIDTIENYVDSVFGSSIARGVNKVFGRSQGISPADITYISYNDDGSFIRGGDSPHHGDYPGASKTWVFPGDARVVDNSGTVYATSTLNYLSSFGGAIDDITFYGNDIPIVRRGNRIAAYSNSLLPTGSKDLAFTPQTMYVAGTNVLAFTSDLGRPSGIRVDAVPLSDLNPAAPGQPVNPNGLSFTPDNVFADANGVVYLFSKSHQSLFRWDSVNQKYLVTIPLVEVPSFAAYSPETRRAYLAYGSGLIREIDLNGSNHLETAFAVLATAPLGLATAGPYVFAVDSSGAWVTHYTFSPTGTPISSVDWNYYSRDYVWREPNQKMYFFRDDTSPNDVLWEEINANATSYTNLPSGGIGRYMDSPLHTSEGFMHPIRVAPDGSVVVLGSGVLHDARTLQRLTPTLANTITDAAWLSGGDLRTVRTISGVSQFQQWTAPAYGLGVIRQFPGQAHRLLAVNSNLVGISLAAGRPTFYVLDASFNVIAPPVIEPPGGLIATIASSSLVTLSWNDVAGEESYAIERKTGSVGAWGEIGTTGMGATTFADSSVPSGNVVYYRVIARNGSKSSAPSSEAVAVLIIPVAPGNVALSDISSNRLTVTWSDVDHENNYLLERRAGAGGSWQSLATLPANTTSFADANLNPDTQYSYQLRARNGVGSSPYSAAVSATTVGAFPTAPVLNAANPASAFSVQLLWSDSLYEVGYVIERRNASAGNWSIVAVMPSNSVSYVDGTVQPVTTYDYRIDATNRFGSSRSNMRSVTTPQKPSPPRPENLVARTVSSTAISISWSDVPGESGFRVQRRTEDPASWTVIALMPENVLTLVDTNVTQFTQYFYRVEAFNEVGSSQYSNEDDAMAFDVVCVVQDAFEPEADPAAWSTITAGIAANGGTGFMGSTVLWFGGAGARAATTVPVDTTLGGTIEFYIRAGNQATDGNAFWNNSEQGEELVLEYSKDGGYQWTQIRSLGGVYPSLNSWTQFSVPIPGSASSVQTQFRWRQLANSGQAFDTWGLDNICVQTAAPPAPEAPPFIISSPNSSTSVGVLWIGSPGTTRYSIERKQGTGLWTELASVSGAITYFTDNSALPAMVHSYRVKAANAGGQSGYSPVTAAVTWSQSEDWIYENYGSKDALDPTAMLTAGADGICPLLRFAFNVDAIETMHVLSPGVSASGAPAIWLDTGTGRLMVEFVRRKASSRPGVAYAVLFGSTLSDWSVGGTLVHSTSIDAIWERVRYQDSVGLEAAEMRFCRVGVSVE